MRKVAGEWSQDTGRSPEGPIRLPHLPEMCQWPSDFCCLNSIVFSDSKETPRSPLTWGTFFQLSLGALSVSTGVQQGWISSRHMPMPLSWAGGGGGVDCVQLCYCISSMWGCIPRAPRPLPYLSLCVSLCMGVHEAIMFEGLSDQRDSLCGAAFVSPSEPLYAKDCVCLFWCTLSFSLPCSLQPQAPFRGLRWDCGVVGVHDSRSFSWPLADSGYCSPVCNWVSGCQ